MRQLKLVPSGVQGWHSDTIAAGGESFAYSSTMALHVFHLKDNTLHKMIAAHERAISAICWCPNDDNLLVSCSVSGRVAVWDLEQETERFAAKMTEGKMLLDWAPAGDRIAVCLESGEVKLWEFREDKQTKLFALSGTTGTALRWHPRLASRLLVGTADGSLHVFDQQTGKKVQITGKSKTSKDAVTDAQWDPLSEDYLLAAFQDGSLVLLDASSQREIHSFDRQAQPIRSLAWAKAQPGNFVTCTDRVGLLKIWNVSQKAPLAQVKVGTAGVNGVKAIPSEPNWFLLAFKNGSVGICDIAQRSMRFMTTPGHSETIFDCVFHPLDPDVLGTASYDGYVKLWRISTGESMRDMFAGKDCVLYGLAFGPGATRVCAVTNSGTLIVWRTDTGEQVLKQQLHSGQAYRCEWNQKFRKEGTGEIATGGADGAACIVDAATGNIMSRLTHPGPVIGVMWHPSMDGTLATACKDGNVRIFNLAEFSAGVEPQAQVVISGHESRVFNIAFHPVCPGLIASGSDDKSIRVWNWLPQFDKQRELRRLNGHTSYVRGLIWHSELPGILLSGSWDATIRVWDVVARRQLHVCHEHHADVYGIALHPERPFFLASSSRDTTLRLWVFEDVVRPLLVQAVVQPGNLDEILGTNPDEIADLIAMPVGAAQRPPTKLFGPASRALAAAVRSDLAAPGRQPCLQVYRRILSFFLWRPGIDNLWGLLAAIRGEKLPGAVGSNAAQTMFHEKELMMCQKSRALELASQRGAMGLALKQEERMLKAAQLMLRIGDLQSYCRFTAQAGQWERAICIAPAVSLQFWKQLSSEYVESLSATTDMEEAAPFWVAIGQSSKLVDAYIERGELDQAFVVAKANASGIMPAADKATPAVAPALAPAGAGGEARARLEDVAAVLASRYAQNGEPLQAAHCFLAVSAVSRAVSTLLRSHEVVLAFVIEEVLDQHKSPLILQLLAQCAERDCRWTTAADLWRQHPNGSARHLPLLAVRCPDKELAQTWHPYTSAQHQEQLAAALAAGDRPSATLHAVCAGDHAQAAQLGVEGLYEMFAQPGWQVEQARALLDPLESLPLPDMSVKDIANILSCAAFLGLVDAKNLCYDELMFPLAQTLRNIVTHQSLDFPVTIQEITLLELSGLVRTNPSQAVTQLATLLGEPGLPAHVRPAVEQALEEARRGQSEETQWPPADGPGLGGMSGGHLPSCYKRFAKTSVLTNQLIKGPAFELEDQNMHVSLTSALAWSRVNVFSPLNTGCKISPL